MRVLAWVPLPLRVSPGQRFRIEQWAPHLAAHGIEVCYAPFLDGTATALMGRPDHLLAKASLVLRGARRRLLQAARKLPFDLVYIFREGALLGPALAERMLGLRGVPFVFDFDDAVWVRYISPANGPLSYLRFPGKTATLCRRARHVMAGNEYLRDYALRHSPRVSVVPTTIDTEKYRPVARKPKNELVVGWSGSFSTVQYLALVRPALEQLARRRSFRVRVVGGSGFSIPGVQVECVPWREETEVADISSFDVGLMPLPDDDWSRGKCGLKVLQYMALGVPAVASPVGVNSQIIRHGWNGLLAAGDEDWIASLDQLLASEPMRRGMGEHGRRTVEQGYSAAVVAPQVAGIFREAAR